MVKSCTGDEPVNNVKLHIAHSVFLEVWVNYLGLCAFLVLPHVNFKYTFHERSICNRPWFDADHAKFISSLVFACWKVAWTNGGLSRYIAGLDYKDWTTWLDHFIDEERTSLILTDDWRTWLGHYIDVGGELASSWQTIGGRDWTTWLTWGELASSWQTIGGCDWTVSLTRGRWESNEATWHNLLMVELL